MVKTVYVEKKPDILKAATALFSKNGYHAVGVDSIVAASNVAKMTFYKYFPSKEYLIEQVLEKRDGDLRESIYAAMKNKRSPQTKIKALFDWYEAWFNTSDYYGCMFIKASDEFPNIGGRIKAISKAHKLWLEGVLDELLQEMAVKAHTSLAIAIMVMLDGLTVRTNMIDFNEAEIKGLMRASWQQVETLIGAPITPHKPVTPWPPKEK